eukprot:452967-Alexandrium_andersonii.AAC.1
MATTQHSSIVIRVPSVAIHDGHEYVVRQLGPVAQAPIDSAISPLGLQVPDQALASGKMRLHRRGVFDGALQPVTFLAQAVRGFPAELEG